MDDQEKGLYCKYHVRHADGSPLSPGFLFILRPDRDPAAWQAVKTYAETTKNPALRADLFQWLQDNPSPDTPLCDGSDCREQATWRFWYVDEEAAVRQYCDRHIGPIVVAARKPYEHYLIQYV